VSATPSPPQRPAQPNPVASGPTRQGECAKEAPPRARIKPRPLPVLPSPGALGSRTTPDASEPLSPAARTTPPRVPASLAASPPASQVRASAPPSPPAPFLRLRHADSPMAAGGRNQPRARAGTYLPTDAPMPCLPNFALLSSVAAGIPSAVVATGPLPGATQSRTPRNAR
jgi:hypothetical protein